MAKSKRHFIKGRMNKSLDERLVPNGEYIDAMNVRLGSTEESEVGSVESTKGNELLTTINLGVFGTTEYDLSADAKCIGAFEDGANETIYWFIHDSNQSSVSTGKADLIVSFNTKVQSTEYHVVSFKNSQDTSNTTLNFNPSYLITEVNKVGDLLFFTDNYNPPRKINVNESYPYPTSLAANDGFTSDDLLVIVKPPHQAPKVTGVKLTNTNSYLEDKFICFGYRYKYKNNEYSATSIFSNPIFSPNPFNLSVETNLNEGMTNSFDRAEVLFNSGEKSVTDIEILVKESDSSQIRVVESLNKEDLNYLDNLEYTYSFTENKVFTVLSSGEILRLYDNVPLLAKTQTLMGNRIMYGNYVDGYNLTRGGSPTNINFSTEVDSKEIGATTLSSNTINSKTYTYGSATGITSNGQFDLNLSSIQDSLISGSTISFSFNVTKSSFNGNPPDEPNTSNQNVAMGFSYTLLQDFDNVGDLINSTDFQEKIGTSANIKTTSATYCDGITFTDTFNCSLKSSLQDVNGVDYFKWKSGITGESQPITATLVNPSTLRITIVAMSYTSDVSNPSGANTFYEYYDVTALECFFQKILIPQSLHSNRGYQVGVVYMDDFNRATTALISPNNTVRVPCKNSTTQNKIKLTIPSGQLAPEFATRYKFVIKPDTEKYETIYTRFYFTDPSDSHTYMLLEGENIAKVEEGDVFNVKVDSAGPLNSCVKATVLEKKSQAEDFITGTSAPAGVYMKMLANNFAANKTDGLDILPGKQTAEENSGGENVTLEYKNFSTESGGTISNQVIKAGSKIRITFDFFRNQQGGGNSCEYRSYKLTKEYTSPHSYTDIIEWWNGENIGDTIDSGTRTPSNIYNYYDSNLATTSGDIDAFKNAASFVTNRYQWYKGSNNEIRFLMSGTKSCPGSGGDANIQATFEVIVANDVLVFETQPSEALPEVWYEGQDSYPIDTTTGYHLDGNNFANPNDQSQSATQDAILYLNFANCHTFGNGVESFTIRDSIKGKSMSLGNRVTTVLAQDYKRVHRDSDITYSGIYNDETNLNRLNEFNLGLANYKSLEDSFGPLNKLYGRETDILSLQEDKISYVLSGKNLLSDASGGDVLTSVPEVLGKQIARLEDFGISDNIESFAAYGYDKFFTDAKRGALIQLKGSSASNEALNVISELGMRSWFRGLFKESFNTQKLGAYDPYMNEYVLSSNDISLPIIEECVPCGQRQSFILKESNVSYCVDVANEVGDITFNFEVPAAAPVNLTVTWNGATQINQSISGLGSVNFSKTLKLPNTYQVTLSQINGLTSDFNITSGCASLSPLKVVDVFLSNKEDANKSLTHNWEYSDGTSYTSSPETQVTFGSSDDTIFSSYYQAIDGFQSQGSVPIKGQDLRMRTIKYGTDTYDIEAADKFMFLATDTLYQNTEADLLSLVAAIKTAGAGNRLTPSTVGISERANFTVPTGSYSYLYLVWDLRLKPASLLCADTNSLDLCCECGCIATNTLYTIANGSSTTIAITYTNTSGNVVSTSMQPNQREIDLCSQSHPVVSPAASNITVTIKECDCS